MSYIDRFKAAKNNRTTYRAGLLQAKAYRILKVRTNESLATIEEGISSIHWALLGILYDNKEGEGVRPQTVAEELGVEPAFVTVLVADLKKKGYVQSHIDAEDNRAKQLLITTKGRTFVVRAEEKLRAAMRPLLSGLSAGEITGYLVALEKIIKNSNQ